MADIGYIALLLALPASIYAVIALIVGERKGHSQLVASGRNAVLAVCGLVLLASIALLHALVTHDFELDFVYSYTSSDMSLVYIIGAFWAGNVGSLLFMTLALSVFGAIMVIQNWRKKGELVSYASSIIAAIEVIFLLMLIAVANPFEKLAAVPLEGRGLNPLLENPGMLIHPPTLLIGYVAFAIPFAFAIAALISGRLGDQWIKDSRKWTIFAWLTLGIGNAIGMWWAYVELGWGGYWAWDPVENAGLLPWLLGTAFLHSVMMQRKRGMFKIFSMTLIIAAFTMCIFGTYLTRSNLLSSVHTFGDTGVEPYFLTLLFVIIAGSVGLLIYRWKELRDDNKLSSILSREAAFLAANILFVAATVIVFLGTMWPKITRTFGTEKEWQTSQFNVYVGSIFMLIILIMGICAVIGWRRASVGPLKNKFLIPLIGALLLCIVLAIVGVHEWYALIFFPLLAFVAFTILIEWYRGVRARRRVKGENPPKAFFKLITSNRARYGGMIVHLGIILMAMGIIGSYFYNTETEASLEEGQSMTIQEYTLTYDGWSQEETASKTIITATLSVHKGEEFVTEIKPQKYFHHNYQQPVTEVAIRTNWATGEDLYVSMDSWTNDGSVFFFTAKVNPLVNWIWIGGGVFLLGGLITFWPDRPKKPKREEG